jgi:serine/threonine protein kinase
LFQDPDTVRGAELSLVSEESSEPASSEAANTEPPPATEARRHLGFDPKATEDEFGAFFEDTLVYQDPYDTDDPEVRDDSVLYDDAIAFDTAALSAVPVAPLASAVAAETVRRVDVNPIAYTETILWNDDPDAEAELDPVDVFAQHAFDARQWQGTASDTVQRFNILPFPELLSEVYAPVGVIGGSGMTSVYLAVHKKRDQPVAVKLFDTRRDKERRLVKKFLDEARRACKLTGDNIVTIFESGVAEDTPFLVMEFVEGRTLADILNQQGTLSDERFVEVFEQVCLGLREGHRAGIVHRDIKPSNILIAEKEDGSWLVKLADFGISKSTDNTAGIDLNLNKMGDVHGTPFYMSPEQCMGRPADKRSDIFSLGCVMYETATGSLPTCGDNLTETVRARLTETPKTFGQLQIKFNKKLEKLTLKCLHKDLNARYKNVDEVLKDLLKCKKRKKVPRKFSLKSAVRNVKCLVAVAGSVALVGAVGTFISWKLAPFDMPGHWQRYREAVTQHDDRKAATTLLAIIDNKPSDTSWTTPGFLYSQDLAKRGLNSGAEDILAAMVKQLPKTKIAPAERARILKLYGDVLVKQGNDLTGKQVYEQLVALQRTYKSDAIITGIAEQALGDIAKRERRPADAADHYQKAIMLYRNNPAYMGGVADNYAALLHEQGNFAEAEKYFDFAKKAFLKSFGPKSAFSVYGTTLLGEFYLKNRKPALAEDNFRESLSMLKNVDKKDAEYEVERVRLRDLYRQLLKQTHREKDLPKIEASLSR